MLAADVSKNKALISYAFYLPSSKLTYLSYSKSHIFPTNVITTPGSLFSTISLAQPTTLSKDSRLTSYNLIP